MFLYLTYIEFHNHTLYSLLHPASVSLYLHCDRLSCSLCTAQFSSRREISSSCAKLPSKQKFSPKHEFLHMFSSRLLPSLHRRRPKQHLRVQNTYSPLLCSPLMHLPSAMHLPITSPSPSPSPPRPSHQHTSQHTVSSLHRSFPT